MWTRLLPKPFRFHLSPCSEFKPILKIQKEGFHDTRQAVKLTPKPSSLEHAWRSCVCGELRTEHVGMKMQLCGWLHYSRLSGRFLVLRDGYGMVQVYCETPLNVSIPLESVLCVVGTVRARPEKDVNKAMSTGEVEVLAENVEVINPVCTDLSFRPKDWTTTNENERLKYRYIDMRTDYLQRNLRFRSTLTLKMRNFLCQKLGFIEVETPYLFKKTPGGAREFLVPTHFQGQFYSLPQSPQQFKQLLMVGGIDRYMQIARCFRDEASRSDRQPEFTQLDLELSFTTAEEIYHIIEDLIADFWPLVENIRNDGIDLICPFPRLTYDQAMTKFGSDKPDIRFDFEFSLPDENGFVGFAVPSSEASVLSKHDWDEFQGMIESATQDPVRFDQAHNVPTELRKRINCDPNDTVVFIKVKNDKQLKILGLARLELAKLLHIKGEWVSVHHPFTAPTTETTQYLYSDPSKVIGQHYDLVCNGQEIAGGSIRIHDPAMQEYVLSNILKESVPEMQYFFDALKSGAPPHGGIAIGLDRFLAIILNAPSIRDVIAFPKAAQGKDLLCGSPTEASPADLEFYGLKLSKCK